MQKHHLVFEMCRAMSLKDCHKWPTKGFCMKFLLFVAPVEQIQGWKMPSLTCVSISSVWGLSPIARCCGNGCWVLFPTARRC